MDVQYAWQQTLVDAFLSLPAEVFEKVAIAQQAIKARLKESSELELAERIALDDAERALRVLNAEASLARGERSQAGQKRVA